MTKNLMSIDTASLETCFRLICLSSVACLPLRDKLRSVFALARPRLRTCRMQHIYAVLLRHPEDILKRKLHSGPCPLAQKMPLKDKQAYLQTHALVYKLVSVGFLYPDNMWQKRMLGLIEELDKIGCPYNLEGNIAKIRRFLSPASGHRNLTELQEEHFRLFGPDPVCHLDIAHWIQGDVFMQSRKMAEMAGFYRAFGLDMNEGLRVDNLSVAFEFLSYLCLKILHAENIGADNHLETTEKAMNSFRDEFVLPGLDRFMESIKTNSKTGFYEIIGELAKKEIR